MNSQSISFVYFGGEPIGKPVLEELKQANLLPGLIICSPDRPVGRKQTLTPPPVKVWAEEHKIPVWQPESLKNQPEVSEKLQGFDLFVVVAYNKILPKWLIDLPPHKTINLHPSLLPLLRGASPIRSTILHNLKDECGVSVMQLDEKMDHGPILAQRTMNIADEHWPIAGPYLDEALAYLGGALLADTIPRYVAGDITPRPQDHAAATYCGRLSRTDGELDINPLELPTGSAAYQALLKIRAFAGYPETYFTHNNIRVKIHDANIVADQLVIGDVTPAGKKRQSFATYRAGLDE